MVLYNQFLQKLRFFMRNLSKTIIKTQNLRHELF